MLSILRIKNLALVVDLTLELQPGLNVITGETGAGKSILIGALGLILGERADRDLIRAGADGCAVEAVFQAGKIGRPLEQFFEENGLESCEEGQLVIKRAFTLAGTNRQFINGSPTTLATIAKLGEWLVDLHGPHDHQSLLYPGGQLAILDAFGGLEKQAIEFASLVREHANFREEKARLIVDEKTYAQQLDLLRFQVREISAAGLHPGDEVVIEQEHLRASNATRLLDLGRKALDLLSEGETSLLETGAALGRVLHELSRVDSAATELTEIHARCIETLQELQAEVSRYSDRIELDPARLHELEERLNLLQTLRRKYGSTASEIIAFSEEAAKRLLALEQRDAEVERLNKCLSRVEAEMVSVGQKLSAQRHKVIPRLSAAVTKELGALGFKACQFHVALSTDDRSEFDSNSVSSNGLDRVEFQFAPNPGEPPRPLRAIASSGEMARVMLALKTVLAEVDRVPLLVFDEVDANIGGETAHAVGEKMEQISRKRQVICITHSAQVAAQGSTHFRVNKFVKGGRTQSELELLRTRERVAELARMLGGNSEAAIRHAESLLTQGSQA